MSKGWLGDDDLVHWVINDFPDQKCVEISCVVGYPTTAPWRITKNAVITCLICIVCLTEDET